MSEVVVAVAITNGFLAAIVYMLVLIYIRLGKTSR